VGIIEKDGLKILLKLEFVILKFLSPVIDRFWELPTPPNKDNEFVDKVKALIEEINRVKAIMLNAKMLNNLAFICNYKGVALIKSISMI
jgi:hypothetical protein